MGGAAAVGGAALVGSGAAAEAGAVGAAGAAGAGGGGLSALEMFGLSAGLSSLGGGGGASPQGGGAPQLSALSNAPPQQSQAFAESAPGQLAAIQALQNIASPTGLAIPGQNVGGPAPQPNFPRQSGVDGMLSGISADPAEALPPQGGGAAAPAAQMPSGGVDTFDEAFVDPRVEAGASPPAGADSPSRQEVEARIAQLQGQLTDAQSRNAPSAQVTPAKAAQANPSARLQQIAILDAQAKARAQGNSFGIGDLLGGPNSTLPVQAIGAVDLFNTLSGRGGGNIIRQNIAASQNQRAIATQSATTAIAMIEATKAKQLEIQSLPEPLRAEAVEQAKVDMAIARNLPVNHVAIEAFGEQIGRDEPFLQDLGLADALKSPGGATALAKLKNGDMEGFIAELPNLQEIANKDKDQRNLDSGMAQKLKTNVDFIKADDDFVGDPSNFTDDTYNANRHLLPSQGFEGGPQRLDPSAKGTIERNSEAFAGVLQTDTDAADKREKAIARRSDVSKQRQTEEIKQDFAPANIINMVQTDPNGNFLPGTVKSADLNNPEEVDLLRQQGFVKAPTPSGTKKEVGLELAPRTVGDIEKTAISVSNSRESMIAIRDAWDPQFSTFAGKFRSSTTNARAYLEGTLPLNAILGEISPEDRQFAEAFEVSQAQTAQQFTQAAKAMSGVAINPEELKRMELFLPNRNDGPIRFSAKVKNSIAHSDYAMVRLGLFTKNRGEAGFNKPWEVSREVVSESLNSFTDSVLAELVDKNPDAKREDLVRNAARITERQFNISKGGLRNLINSIADPKHWSER